MKKILKEPLLHFLFAGFLVFLFCEQYAPSPANDDTIIVNKQALMTLMQYRSKAFEGDYFEEKFDKLGEAERQQLIEDYVREEALFREAKQLNLGEEDYIIKRRMIQKVDFIYQNRIAKEVAFPEDSLLQFFNANKVNYLLPAHYTFSHIFFKAKNKGFQTALDKANAFVKETNTSKIDFNESLKYGERFLYHRHYVEKEFDFLEGHFGGEFAEGIKALETDKTEWSEPIQSKHGYHLVLLTNKVAASKPNFKDIKAQLSEDYKRTFEQDIKSELMDAIIDRYKVVLDL
ncbi:MAG: peptidyl-prolyl cis-trans isomerase [Chitinophagales bacterium]